MLKKLQNHIHLLLFAIVIKLAVLIHPNCKATILSANDYDLLNSKVESAIISYEEKKFQEANSIMDELKEDNRFDHNIMVQNLVKLFAISTYSEEEKGWGRVIIENHVGKLGNYLLGGEGLYLNSKTRNLINAFLCHYLIKIKSSSAVYVANFMAPYLYSQLSILLSDKDRYHLSLQFYNQLLNIKLGHLSKKINDKNFLESEAQNFLEVIHRKLDIFEELLPSDKEYLITNIRSKYSFSDIIDQLIISYQDKSKI